MTTVLAVYAMKGCIGVCDARCYNAKQPSELKEPRRNACICICGGANHGLGLNHAVKNAAVHGVGLSPEALATFAAERGWKPEQLVVIDRVRMRSSYTAARFAKKLLNPPPIMAGDDLFACEAVS